MKTKKSIAILIFLTIFSSIISAEAHMPGAKPPPESKLKPIVMNDGEAEIEITIEDVAEYHNQKTKQISEKILAAEGKSDAEIDKIIKEEFSDADGKCSCVSCSFRATLLGIQKLWGKEIPERSDIKIISYLPSSGSVQCFKYITGNASEVPNARSNGEFVLVRLPGKKAMDIGIDSWNFAIIRKSTGDRFEIQTRKDIFPESFFELRKKVNIEKSATEEEIKKYSVMWQKVRDAFLTKADWELFEGIKEPFPVGGAIFFSLLIIGTGSLLYVKNSGNKKSLKRT